MKKSLGIIIAVLAIVALAIIFLNRGPATSPDDDPEQEQEVEQPQDEYDNYAGNIWLNAEEIEMEQQPIIDKGIVYLPLQATAIHLNVDINFDDTNNVILIGDSEGPAERQEDFKVYKNNANLTPRNIINLNGDFYISYREIAPLLDIYIYESMFENALYLVDDSNTPQDGEYVAVNGRDQRGWAPRLVVNIEDGQIESATYNEYNPDGQAKFDDEQYLQNWGNAADIDPREKTAQLESQLVESQSVPEIDVTTGATSTYINFTQMASLIMAQSRVSQLDRNYVDGNYEVYGNPANNGWTPYINFEVNDGEITNFEYDEVDQNGNFKTENRDYLDRWNEAFPDVDQLAIIQQAQDQIVLTQDPNTIDATTGATSWGRNMKILTMGALLQAQQADLNVDFDTLYVVFGEQNERGDRPQLLVTMLNDQMTAVDFSDYRNGVSKKQDEPYLANWRTNYPDVDPPAVVQEMEQIFLQEQEPDALDAVSGATSWREAFKDLGARALEIIENNN